MKKINKYPFKILNAVFVSFILLCSGCKPDVHEQFVDFEIITPKDNRVYYTDEKILFSTNLKNSDFEWTSSIDGFLGTESLQVLSLSEGTHEIQLTSKLSNITKTVRIKVEEKVSENEWQLLTGLPQEIYVKNDFQNLGFCSLAGSCNNIKAQVKSDIDSFTVKRDFNFKCNRNTLLFKRHISSRSAINKKISDEEFFNVINTENQNEFHQIEGKKYYADENIVIYVEKSFYEKNNCKEKIDICIRNFNSIILPRLKILWGKCADIDDNGVITILFTSTINKEKTAVGFFYPNDLFSINMDINSESYNPYSNEKDIIYVAFPSDEDSNYSTGSISATLAHEMTHAISFSNRIVFPLLKNEEPLDQMETFLDEGLSHLTESLCGFGDSGGNSSFVNYYLKNSGCYSFCKNDIYGAADSVGQRGAVSLFLYYLFEKAGGISWNNNTLQIRDEGGIRFLQDIVKSSESSWHSIGQAFGKPTDFLFLDFAKNLLENNITDTKKDPVTNENVFSHNELSTYKTDESFKLLEYSILKQSQISGAENILEILGDGLKGNVYAFPF